MRFLLLVSLIITTVVVKADTIDNYMNIANNIPKMEMKADPQSQAWARSARNVLAITEETIAETLMQANAQAIAAGKPLFCLPTGTSLNAVTMSGLIQQTYRELPQAEKNKYTVSQIAWIGVTKKYSCQGQATQHIQQMLSATGR